MLHKHFLIAAEECITLSSRFIIFYVSDTGNDAADLSYLQAIAAMNKWYCHTWSLDKAMFMENVAKSVGREIYSLPWEKHQLKCLVKSLKRVGQLPAMPPVNRAAIKLRYILDANFRIQKGIDVIRKAEAKKRKKPKSKDVYSWAGSKVQNDTPSVDGIFK